MTTIAANTAIDAALAEARRHYAERRPLSLAAHTQAARYMPGGNTRTVLHHGPFPLRIERGEGARITDVDGGSYVNLLGEYTAGLFGHSHPAIRRAIDAALDRGVNLGAHNTFEGELARLVVERFPAIHKVRFTNSGTEANLMAVATARHATRRSKVMVFKGGYHGGLLYFGGGGIPINAPYEFIVAPFNDSTATSRLIREHANDLACVLTEAMMGSGGCIPGDPLFMHMLRDETRQAGALLIIDEVMTSRFGHGGAHSLLGIEPDLVTLGKWVGGGMSFGAFGGRAELLDIYDPTRPGFMPHAGTFNNNVLSMSAGIAALTEVFPAPVATALHARGEALRGELNAVFERHHLDLHFSGSGSLMNLHAMAGLVRSVDDLAASDGRLKELFFLAMLERGFYIAPRGFVALSLALDGSDLKGFVNAVDAVCATLVPLCRKALSSTVQSRQPA